MSSKLLKDTTLWGFLLWLFGYVLGIVLFPLVSTSLIGWIIMPLGILATLWVLFKKIQFTTLKQYVFLSFVWVTIAVVFDYFFLVKAFKPADGYYKLDVYLYYLITFLLPLLAGFKKTKKDNPTSEK